ncbi:Gfo/Idh/MocA family protein [Phytoactinopolyspora halotolerans]|uniref:Gfo/Idh/MocA family oxidoreductase n=1 Tax=Phytoactinopolyspora halotolerans TaxID=1981512 RepID=A0A6L9SFC2_9ACTN|nr:Gfo/Idh/MocA family oxidoreductase [Phytoactinopolyspora halotolerans]NEE03906.1 Gfo/Idh/MocA family oxidoreductase [Phytoactinopolyspora halotolerans]
MGEIHVEPGGEFEVLRVGFIGAGAHAMQSIYPSLRYGPIELVAVADIARDRADRCAYLYGASETYYDHEQLLEKADVDAVFVVGPAAMHYSVGIDVVEAGKHLFVEKPPAVGLTQAMEMKESAEQAGVSIMVGFMKRFAAAYQRVREIIAQPDFGARLVQLNYAHWVVDDWHENVGYGIHPVDLARYFLGDVTDGTVNRRHFDDGSVLTVELYHVDGGTTQLNLSSCAPGVKESVNVFGASELVEVRNLTHLRRFHRAPSMEAWSALSEKETMSSVWEPEFTIPVASHSNLVIQGYAGEVRYFSERIIEGKSVTPSIDDAIETMRILDAIENAPIGKSDISFRI